MSVRSWSRKPHSTPPSARSQRSASSARLDAQVSIDPSSCSACGVLKSPHRIRGRRAGRASRSKMPSNVATFSSGATHAGWQVGGVDLDRGGGSGHHSRQHLLRIRNVEFGRGEQRERPPARDQVRVAPAGTNQVDVVAIRVSPASLRRVRQPGSEPRVTSCRHASCGRSPRSASAWRSSAASTRPLTFHEKSLITAVSTLTVAAIFFDLAQVRNDAGPRVQLLSAVLAFACAAATSSPCAGGPCRHRGGLQPPPSAAPRESAHVTCPA